MINLDSEEYNEKTVNPIFNGGQAGVVKGVTARIERKKDGDNPKSPDFKIFFIDDKNGEMNVGYYDDKDAASDKGKAYFVREMKHLARESGIKLPNEIASLSDLLNLTMKGLSTAMPKNKYNVAVSFGKKTYPKSFLEISGGFWAILNVESDRMPNLDKEAVIERPVQDDEITITGDDDMPFKEEGTTNDLDW